MDNNNSFLMFYESLGLKNLWFFWKPVTSLVVRRTNGWECRMRSLDAAQNPPIAIFSTVIFLI